LPLGFGPDGVPGTSDDSTLPEGTFAEEFQYDDLGREILHVSFEGRVAQSVYDANTGRQTERRFFDNLTAYDDGNGTPSDIVAYVYDAFGRTVEVVQDADGNLETTADQRVTDTSYNGKGRVVSITSPEGIVNYEYDPVTGQVTRTYTGAVSTPIDDVRYTFDALGRLSTVEVYERNGVMVDVDPNTTGDQPEVTRYDYDLLGNLARERKPNGAVVDYVYDNLNRLTDQNEFDDVNADGDYDSGTDILLSSFDYSLRADGKRSGVTEEFWFDDDADQVLEQHQNTISWTYDDIGRLTDEVFDHYDNDFDQTEHFVYDLVGNRVQKTLDKGNDSSVDETTDYVYDANDRLTTESLDTDGQPGYERVTTYGYDHTQQTLKEVRESGVLQAKTEYTYDLQGRMASAKVTAYTSGTPSRVERITYGYDSNGIRVSALLEVDTDADGTYDTAIKTEYLNDPQNPTGYSQVLTETTIDVATQEIQKRIIYAIGHALISQTTITYADGQPQSSQTLYFGRDGHGSNRFLENADAEIVPDQVFSYDAFGSALGFNPSTVATAFLYSGEHFEVLTALQYLRARYYDPNTGRFNTLDPYSGNIGDPFSLHKYLYCSNDTINRNDPTGQFWGAVAVIGIGAAIGAIAGWWNGGDWNGSWSQIAWGAGFGVAAGVIGLASFSAFSALAGMFLGETATFWVATFLSGFVTGAIIDVFAGVLHGESATEVFFDALEGGVKGAALAGVFGILYRGGTAAWGKYRAQAAQQPAPAAVAGPSSWVEQQVNVARTLRQTNAPGTVFDQIGLRVKNLLNGLTRKVTPDNLVKLPNGKYKIHSAKFSEKDEILNPGYDLMKTLTQRQKDVYPWVRDGVPIEVKVFGESAARLGLLDGQTIQLEVGVTVHAGTPNGTAVRQL
jgi:RHS repeat-associated protein